MDALTLFDGIVGGLLLLSSLGVLLLKQPVHACLSFLMTLLLLSILYLGLEADFIAVMQILVYAGAILVLFMFVIVLFQDAHQKIDTYAGLSSRLLVVGSVAAFSIALAVIGVRLRSLVAEELVSVRYGTVESLGRDLYLDFFFPFEAVVLLFLAAIIGSLYIAKRRL